MKGALSIGRPRRAPEGCRGLPRAAAGCRGLPRAAAGCREMLADESLWAGQMSVAVDRSGGFLLGAVAILCPWPGKSTPWWPVEVPTGGQLMVPVPCSSCRDR
jgi:hypothetical protein